MIDKLAGLPTQIRNLEKRLKDMDASKISPAKIKEITDTIKNLKDMLKEKMDKREQRKKQKEDASKEVAKEADSGSITTTTTSPAAPQAPGAMTTPTSTTTPATTPDDQKSQCALCGGLTFPDYPSYQQHMEFTHASDVMPTTPGQKEDKLVASVDPVVDKVETDPKLAPGVIVPDSVKRHNDIVDRVEKDPKIAPHIISEKEEGPKFKLDDVVKPVRGAESTGKVMRWDGKPSDLVYVAWDSGPLSERDTFGGYYPHDLELFQEEPVEAAMPMEKPACADCTSMKEKHGDLKTNYESLLKDLKEERDIHYTQGNSSWVARLDQKILDLQKSIEEKFGIEPEACTACGQKKESADVDMSQTAACKEGKHKECKNMICQCPHHFAEKKTAGSQNAEDLTVMDHTPPRANSGPDAGGKDTHDEFQDEWAMPAGVEMVSKRGTPGTLYNAETAQSVSDRIQSEVKAPLVWSSVSMLGGPQNVGIYFTIAAEPKDQWPNGILENSRYGKFVVYNDGEVEQHSGSFGPRPYSRDTRISFRKRTVKSVDQLIQVLNSFLDQVNTVPNAQAAPAKAPVNLAVAPKAASLTDEVYKWCPVCGEGLKAGQCDKCKKSYTKKQLERLDNPSEPKEAALSAPVTEPTKLTVFKKEFTATPITDQKKFGGYDISDATGKKILNIKSKDSQPMTQDQLEFCAQIELTRGLKQAKLVEKVAFLEAGSKVYIIASDRTGKRVKFASMEQGIRGWAPLSKFAFVNKEGEMRKHKDHIDNTFGHNGKEILVDCPNGSGNMTWLPMGELLPITPPPATPESLNDLESEKQCPKCKGVGIPGHGSCPVCGGYATDMKERKQSEKQCPDCHGTFEGAEGETCPTCGRFAVQKTALKPALPPQILNRRNEVNASIEKQSHIRHEGDKWIVYNHDYTKQLGHYKTKAEALKRLRQIEYFKHKGSLRPFSKKADYFDPDWTTKKVGEFYDEMMAEKFMMDNYLENGFYKKEGNKYVVYVDVPINSIAAQKKAEVLSDPYQSLTDHITDMKSRMSQVQDKMQTMPAVKTAGEDEKDNSKMDVPSIFADIAQGIDLLETKLKDKEDSEEIHKNLEELENMLWKIEMESGIIPNLPEHEKAESEHKEIVDDIEDKKKVNKSAVDVTVTDETLEEGEGIPPTATTPAAVAPTIQNVQPTDADNLEIPVAKPTSPPAPGQIWVYNADDKVYVSMPDPANPGKQI